MPSNRVMVGRRVAARTFASALLAAVVLVARPGAARAQEAPDRATASRRAARIEQHLMSPFCPGLTLYTCTSPAAAAWRGEIREWSAQGVREAEIRDRLQARVPDFDLSGQPAGERSWVLPVATTLLSTLVLLAVALRMRWRSAPGAGSPFEARPPTDDEPEDPGAREQTAAGRELDRRLDSELEAFDLP